MSQDHAKANGNITYRPHVVVAKRPEQIPRRDAFAIMHIAFRGIVAKDSIDDNANFAIGEPSIGAEPCLGSDRR